MSLRDTVQRIMDHKMVPDTLPHSTRSSITIFRSYLALAIFSLGYTLSAISRMLAAELFPFAPRVYQDKDTDYMRHHIIRRRVQSPYPRAQGDRSRPSFTLSCAGVLEK